ncbi:YceI family protein [Simiduia curdlanivorans]|uniref:YceI family protein n=1 Tax=Simiduia curdlanivorans TaxID=1492769 RepID=A0ABV8V7I1_9GAMM|nr:YceI family protein [Simiduia curdlanivorans]MDN3640790.1 YceI family protein [Simiduia curdlanivorans]
MKWIVNALFVLAASVSVNCLADWTLNAEHSQLHVVSVKNAAMAEVHQFTKLDGKVDAKGQVSVLIDLASIETQIPIRNERMQTMLFDTANFAMAKISTKVDVAKVNALKLGESMAMVLPCVVQLHGKEKTLEVAVSVVALAQGQLQVASIKPVVLALADFELIQGAQALQDIAKLNSIAVQVPVMFNLRFAKAN